MKKPKNSIIIISDDGYTLDEASLISNLPLGFLQKLIVKKSLEVREEDGVLKIIKTSLHNFLKEREKTKKTMESMGKKGLALDKEDIARTGRNNQLRAEEKIKKVENYKTDKQRDQRLGICHCKYCFYFTYPVIAGQAFTNADCKNCKKTVTYPNTATLDLCEDCSKKHKLCRKCTGKID